MVNPYCELESDVNEVLDHLREIQRDFLSSRLLFPIMELEALDAKLCGMVRERDRVDNALKRSMTR